jgi:hypothetical protein
VLPERDAPWSLAGTLLRRAVDVAAALPRRSAAAVAELLADGPPSGLDPGTWRALAPQGAAGVLTAAGGALVVADDLQWADSSSLDVLLRVAGRGDGPAIVLAYRPEKVAEGSAAAGFLAHVRASSGPAELSRGRLGTDALGDLVDDPGWSRRSPSTATGRRSRSWRFCVSW